MASTAPCGLLLDQISYPDDLPGPAGVHADKVKLPQAFVHPLVIVAPQRRRPAGVVYFQAFCIVSFI